MAGKSVPKVKQKLDKKDLTLSLAFLLPAILITVIFVIYPVFDTVGLSFRKWNGMFGAAKQWVGLENYQKIFSDKLFWNAMLNSVYFMIGGFVMGICILHDWSNGSGSLYTDPDQQHCNSIKCKEQPVLPDPDLCCVWYVPGDIPLYRIHGWNLQEPG